jgi:hypothetical protein
VTEPQPVMAQAEQDQLTRQVGRALLSAAGADWQQVRAEYRSAGRHIEVDVFVKGPDGVERPVRPPQEVVDGLGRLRQGMYRPGRGTWLSALYVLDPPSSFSAEFEPDVEPRWRRVPPPIGFADELKFFPREDENIPDWFRQRAGLPPRQPAEGDAAGPPQGQAPAPGMPTPPPGMPAAGAPTPPPGTPMPGTPTPPPGTPRPGMPAPPPGTPTPARGMPAPPGVPQQTPPSGMPQQNPPTPPPGMPQHTPPSGMPQQGMPPQGGPTQPPGVPATPYGNPGPASPPRGFQEPGIPAGPFGVPATPYQDDQNNR